MIRDILHVRQYCVEPREKVDDGISASAGMCRWLTRSRFTFSFSMINALFRTRNAYLAM